MEDFSRGIAESPQDWLKRLGSMNVSELTLTEKRALTAYLAEARRLLQEEQQKVRWSYP